LQVLFDLLFNIMATDTYNPAYSELQPFDIVKNGKLNIPPYNHFNPRAYAKLEELTAKETGYRAWGSLIDVTKYLPSPGIQEARIKSEKVWHFLTNPQSVDFSRSVNWVEQPTLSSNATMMNYGHTSGGVITLNDILLPCNCPPKNLQEYMNRLQNLMVAPKKSVTQQTPNAPLNADYRAPYLALVWGANIRYPVVIKDIKWKETQWHKGVPVYLNLSITLQELPIPLRPNAFGKTGSELDKELGRTTLRDRRQSKIEEIRQKLQGYYNREGIFALRNPEVRDLMAQLTKNTALQKFSNLTTGNSVGDWLSGIGLLKSLFGDDARQQRQDIKYELEKNIRELDNNLGNPRFSSGDLAKDLQPAIDFYGSIFKVVKPPDLSKLSPVNQNRATRNYYKQLFDYQQQQERLKASRR
jgi:hypothetical protein